ncbi:FtsX-like permease family protein [Bacillus solitudinis]|uniref:FtsX-like permease family protein n=1 Tax=Bacillus solitudinis TaxID=2014074 RepID=UPI000C230C54|nr:FtsX-like permease family protein [Bacillus solitudinis]
MTLFDLVIRSMRKNIKHYYLYFFALILSVVLYFVFATLQYDSAVIAQSGGSMGSAFKVAGILLIFIAGIFVVYANAIFLKRRSREIGLYQLIGLTKRVVAKLLIIENAFLGIIALVIGIVVGMLVSRVFLLLLMKLIGYETFIEVSFSTAAIIQTVVVFIAIFALTTIQMIYTVYRNTLLALFNSDKKGEHPKKPKTVISAFLALLGIALIAFGYWFSGRMINSWLFVNMLIVLTATILGTYLMFRVTISWLFYQIRKRKQGHLGLMNSLSLAPLMHRLKGNANSLTIITVLSAMTLTMIAGSYSLYYATERETRAMMPFDFMFENNEEFALEISEELNSRGIVYQHNQVDMIVVPAIFNNDLLPTQNDTATDIVLLSEQQLQHAGVDVTASVSSVSFHDVSMRGILDSSDLPFEMVLMNGNQQVPMSITEIGEANVINWSVFKSQLVVNDETFNKLKEQLLIDGGEAKLEQIDGFHITNEEDMAKASELYQQSKYKNGLHVDYYSRYHESVQSNGLLIFIAGFLGLVFLISTGSILYFKQMTEAEQEKQSYATLRQLGFTVKDIMHGIIRKQAFVFGLPLAIGLAHSVFAIKAASFLFLSDITLPASIAMVLYALIYLTFAVLTVGYYRNTVKRAL